MGLGVAIIGCGTVGGAVGRLLSGTNGSPRMRLSSEVELAAVYDRGPHKLEAAGIDPSLFCGDFEEILKNPSIHVVAELIGGTELARDVVERSLEAGKDVVTANKALLAHHGAELLASARAKGRVVAFEASCAGGIPILRAFYDGLVANQIDAVYGIVNGTCNFILTEMIEHGRSYSEVLSEAQQMGLAGADPSLDVSGMDSAHKIAIMASLAFGTGVRFEDVSVEGIEDIELVDVQRGHELGYVIKLIGAAVREEGEMALWVRPAFIAQDHPLAWIRGSFNAVSVYGSATGHTMYYGRGAGGDPTASAVVADIASIASGAYRAAFQSQGLWLDSKTSMEARPSEARRSRFYVRLAAEDRSGALAEIASVLGRHDISISSVLQHERGAPDGPYATVVIITNAVPEGRILKAVYDLENLPCTKGGIRTIAVLDEHPEWGEQS